MLRALHRLSSHQDLKNRSMGRFVSSLSSLTASLRTTATTTVNEDQGDGGRDVVEDPSTPLPLSLPLLLQPRVMHPFTGRIICTGSRAFKMLQSFGFRKSQDNPLRICVAEPMECPEPLRLTELGKAVRAKRYGERKWQARIASIGQVVTTREEVHAQLQAALNQGYDALTSSPFLPPKLVALPDPHSASLTLTKEQQFVLDLAVKGTSLFIGGSAGTGKTVLLRAIASALTEKRVAMVATTGVAAIQLGGCTLHFGLDVPMRAQDVWDMQALRAIEVLIVDEVSMMEPQLLSQLDQQARWARLIDRPFGGIQIILCGDFLQLQRRALKKSEGQMLFELPLFNDTLTLVRLTEPLRHRTDMEYFETLQCIRVGCLLNPTNGSNLLAPFLKDVPPEVEASATMLFPTKKRAREVNEMRLSAVPGEVVQFEQKRGPLKPLGQFTPSIVFTTPKAVTRDLVLAALSCSHSPSGKTKKGGGKQKKGVDVEETGLLMFDDDSLVLMPSKHNSINGPFRYAIKKRMPRPSGSRMETTQNSIVMPDSVANEDNSVVTMWEELIRTRLIPAVQGTREQVYSASDLPDEFLPDIPITQYEAEHGSSVQLKVGCRVMVNRNLSRTIANGSMGEVISFMPPNFEYFPNPVVNTVMSGLHRNPTAVSLLPLVRFDSGEVYQIPTMAAFIGGTAETHHYCCDVYRMPLQLGYAFTVHKLQGVTLNTPIIVDCKDYFECPHLLYVAMSRVKERSLVHLRNVDCSMVTIHSTSLEFEERLKMQPGGGKGKT